MTKDIIKQATDAYQAQHIGEYGWTCYRFTSKDGNPVAYLRYENPLAECKIILSATERLVTVGTWSGKYAKTTDIDGDPVEAIVYLLNWMRSHIH